MDIKAAYLNAKLEEEMYMWICQKGIKLVILENIGY